MWEIDICICHPKKSVAVTKYMKFCININIDTNQNDIHTRLLINTITADWHLICLKLKLWIEYMQMYRRINIANVGKFAMLMKIIVASVHPNNESEN